MANSPRASIFVRIQVSSSHGRFGFVGTLASVWSVSGVILEVGYSHRSSVLVAIPMTSSDWRLWQLWLFWRMDDFGVVVFAKFELLGDLLSIFVRIPIG